MADDSKAVAAKAQRRAADARKAMSDYEADQAAVAEKTARLRALRLARDAALPAKPLAAPKRNKTKAAAAQKQATASLTEWLDVQKRDGR